MWLLVLFSITGAIFTLLAPPVIGQKVLATYGPFPFPLAQVYAAALVYSLLLALYILALLLRTPAMRRLRQHLWFRLSGAALAVITTIVLGNLWLIQVISRSLVVGPVLVTYDNVSFHLSGFTFFLVLDTLALPLRLPTTQ